MAHTDASGDPTPNHAIKEVIDAGMGHADGAADAGFAESLQSTLREMLSSRPIRRIVCQAVAFAVITAVIVTIIATNPLATRTNGSDGSSDSVRERKIVTHQTAAKVSVRRP